uniref:F-BAR domain-containing protein n=1 Tax=Arion vulgaris TaxID=1028688 RepID=A0A0B7BE45_9EUPU
MLLADVKMYQTYSDSFWGSDLGSCAGYEALSKRNLDSRKMCDDLEKYLKKRSKLEAEYSKSLQNLSKCFKQREEVGVMEKSFNKFKSEIEAVAQCHNKVAAVFQQQSDIVKKFKEDQTFCRKALEDQLQKSQNFKLSQLSKTIQLEKIYVRKFTEKNAAGQSFSEISLQQVPPKELEKARNKVTKTEEDAIKADSAYKSAVKMLESCRTSWEKDMTLSCQSIQDLDEKRLDFLRQLLWVTTNVNSSLALEIDNSSESVREVLEKCDVASEIQAFIQAAKTGNEHPEPFVFRHYTKIMGADNSDSIHDPYCTIEDVEIMDIQPATPTVAKFGMGFSKLLNKRSTSS